MVKTVPRSIPGGVTEFFQRHISFRPNTVPSEKAVRKADNLPPYRAVVMKSVSLNFLDPSGPARPVMGEHSCSLIIINKAYL